VIDGFGEKNFTADPRSSDGSWSGDPAIGSSSPSTIDDRLQARPDRAGGLGERIVVDDREHPFRVDGRDVRLSVLLVDDHVAGEQDAELGLGPSAAWASVGLQAPRIRYGSRSTPSLALSVAWTSISDRTPNPSCGVP
jgi:hypothetical protein